MHQKQPPAKMATAGFCAPGFGLSAAEAAPTAASASSRSEPPHEAVRSAGSGAPSAAKRSATPLLQ